jgi:hypothetical protein
MKNYALFFIFLIVIGCKQDDFSPIKDFQEKFAVFCVLDSRNDATFLWIQKNSDSWDLQKRIDLSDDLLINIFESNGKENLLRDTVINAQLEYKTYYSDKIGLNPGTYTLQITSREYPLTYAVINYPDASSYQSTHNTEGISVIIKSSTAYFKLHAFIYYDQKINDTWVRKREEFPLSKHVGHERIDFYPGPEFIEENPMYFDIIDEVITRCINTKILPLAAKDDIKIIDGRIIIENYDISFAKYITALNGLYDRFTVRLDQLDFSNISNGMGIFGAYRADTIVVFESSSK